MTSSVESTASDLIPKSTPTTLSGCAGAGSWRSTSTENEQNHRPPWWVRGGRADTTGAAFDMPGELAGGLVVRSRVI
jgi:hypothetical protein